MEKIFDLLQKLSLKASTREFIREGQKIPGYTFLDFLYGYVYGRWPCVYSTSANVFFMGCSLRVEKVNPDSRYGNHDNF